MAASRGPLIVALLTSCSSGGGSAPNEPSIPGCAETIDEYCAKNPCVRSGVPAVGSFSAWCRMAGSSARYADGLSRCYNQSEPSYVVIDVTKDGKRIEYFYEETIGRLVYLRHAGGCAGTLANAQCEVVGVGATCSMPP